MKILFHGGKVDSTGGWYGSRTESVTESFTFTEEMIESHEDGYEGIDSLVGGVSPLYYLGDDVLPA